MRKRLLSLGLIMVLCFSLTGCKSSDYKKAVELQNSGDYAGALELFKGIGDDYKDVSDRATECQSFIDSITAFDEAKSLLDDKNAELDKAISEANDLVNGENTALDESLRSLLETKISETKAIKITAPTMAETVKEIDTQTTEMNTTDYSDALKSLNEAYTAFNNSVKQYELVNNPAESYVIKCLEKVEHVIGISAVTEDNDPNGHLGKAGGYTATVYFTCDWVNQANVIGNTIIDKGTDGGGAIEVYANVEDAESRDSYLAGFDGGVLASGSHTVVGTCVVTVKIDNMTEHRDDYYDENGELQPGNFSQADAKLAEKWNEQQKDGRTDWTDEDVYEWRHDPAHQCSWHERCDTKTMDLVPYDIHSYCKHLGGVSECKARDSVNDGGGFDE